MWTETSNRVIRDAVTGTPQEFLIVVRDTTERKALENKLTLLAMTDGLTGLANRRAFDEALAREWARTLRNGSATSILLLDLDHFKRFNDNYGHQAGDDCLRAVAAAVRASVREADLAARYGGEELVVICPRPPGRRRNHGRSTGSGFIPAPVETLRDVMKSWEEFANDEKRCKDWLVKAACVAFGFVYLHPFLDGNGRIHPFLIHHIIARSGLAPVGVVVPVSALIAKNLVRYQQVLVGFSGPVSALWDHQRGEYEPTFTQFANSRLYRFFNADAEVAFLRAMLEQAVRDKVPRAIAFLSAYDQAFSTLDAEFDLPQPTLAALIRNIQGNQGRISNNIRKKFLHIPVEVFGSVAEVVPEEFGLPRVG